MAPLSTEVNETGLVERIDVFWMGICGVQVDEQEPEGEGYCMLLLVPGAMMEP